MRILLVSSSSGSRGGGELFLVYLAEGLCALGHEPVLWCSRHERMDELAARFAKWGGVVRAEYVNTYDYPLRSLSVLWTQRQALALADSWKRLAPDVVHVNKQNLEDGLELLLAANRTGVPSVCTVHLTQSPRYLGARVAWLREMVAKKYLSAYRGIFASIQDVRVEELRAFAGPKAIMRAVANGIPQPEAQQLPKWRHTIREQLGCDEDTFLLLAVGRLEDQKRPDRFLHWVSQLQARGEKKLRAVWVGDGRQRRAFEAAVQEANLGDVVSCLGWQEEVMPYFAAADVLLHPAQYESFLPLAVLEAMACGLPCVLGQTLANDITALKEHPGIVLVVDDEGTRLASCLHEAERTRASEQARAWVCTEYSLVAMARRYAGLYLQEVRE